MNTTYLELRAALSGNLDAEVRRAQNGVAGALGKALEAVAEDAVGELRQDFSQSGLRNAGRLSRQAWRRDEVYGKGRSLNPAVLIYSRMPMIVQAFQNGGEIRTPNGGALLIPNPDLWPGGRVRRARGTGSGRLSGKELMSIAEARFGPLRVIKRPGRARLIVAEVREGRGALGGFRKASLSARRRSAEGMASGLVTVVVFFMVMQARIPRLLRGKTIIERVERNAAARMEQLFVKYFAEHERAPRQIGTSQVW